MKNLVVTIILLTALLQQALRRIRNSVTLQKKGEDTDAESLCA